MELSQVAINKLADHLANTGVFALKSDMEKKLAAMVKRAAVSEPRSDFSISKAVRGLSAMRGCIVNSATREEDINYAEKALVTGSGAGSYLVPTIQAQEVIEFLSVNSVVRAAGARIWPAGPNTFKFTLPIASGLPTVEWLGQNTSQSASDPGLSQLPVSAKTARALVVLPNELIFASSPAIDTVVSELLGIGFGEAEDTAFFKTTATTNGPSSIYASATTTYYNVGNSANGGNLSYPDITAVLYKSAAAKARGPFVWFMSARTFYQRVLGLIDLQSRPIIVSDPTGPAQFRLFGAPVFISPLIPENQAVGSGSNQSYAVYTNPRYLHIAEAQGMEVAISTERWFELNQVGIRAVRYEDFQFGPEAGICTLRGIN